jgi:tRNA A-37 threonylcarbamoyl transferase component Bud32
MLLMSWAGEQAQKDLMSRIRQDINEETTCAVTKLRYHGVEHCDVRPLNVLWNSKGGNIILVDLEQSEIMKRVPAL